MFPQKNPIRAQLKSETYPLGEKTEHTMSGHAEALVALSHSAVENRLYAAMRSAENENGSSALTARRLKALTGIRSQSTIRRGLEGLLAKLSIERDQKPIAGGTGEPGVSYIAFSPEQIIARRKERGINTYERGLAREGNLSFDRAISRVAENRFLSRREIQVALCCVEGLTNAEIGHRLDVSEQTVKFHLRHIFIKFGVKRRTELISRLLM
jgi:DNA-binding CsgD family transcriptional regulator